MKNWHCNILVWFTKNTEFNHPDGGDVAGEGILSRNQSRFVWWIVQEREEPWLAEREDPACHSKAANSHVSKSTRLNYVILVTVLASRLPKLRTSQNQSVSRPSQDQDQLESHAAWHTYNKMWNMQTIDTCETDLKKKKKINI